RELVRKLHQLASLGVRLLEADDSGVTIQDTTISSLVVEVKSRQQENPSLEQLRAKAQDQQSLAFDIAEDGVLRYSGRLCVPNVGLPRSHCKFDSVWVIVDRLTKSAHFLPVKATFSAENYAGLYIREIKGLGTQVNLSTVFHPQTDGQAERTILALEDMLRACALDFKGSWDDHLPLIEFAYKPFRLNHNN
ncbi:hypothetical protein MTR67_039320, partial [Solanum verrucosum]